MPRPCFTLTRLVGVAFFTAALVCARVLSAADSPSNTSSLAIDSVPLVTAVDSIGMTVADLDRSIAFYTQTLDFEMISEHEVFGEAYERLTGVFGCRVRIARLRLGDEVLELSQYLTPRGRPIPVDAQPNDRSFQHIAIVVSDMDQAYRRLREHDVQHASNAPQTLPKWNQNAAGIRAFYFRDPDGHFLECIWFPADKGLPKWHTETSRLFLGIDHTAIVVSDTGTSLGFYRDTIGLRVVGESENFGTEQEHLNGVFNARLRITTLRAAAGPGVELLEYLTPRTGSDIRSDSRANDVWHWHITMSIAPQIKVDDLVQHVKKALISSDVVAVPHGDIGPAHALRAADPDGHVVQFNSTEPLRNTAERAFR